MHNNGAGWDGSMGILGACRLGDGVVTEEVVAVVAASVMPMGL